jgi:hypothetical protein
MTAKSNTKKLGISDALKIAKYSKYGRDLDSNEFKAGFRDAVAGRDAALKLLRSGQASPSEISAAAGISRQLVNYWLAAENVKWREAREAAVKRAWDKARKS